MIRTIITVLYLVVYGLVSLVTLPVLAVIGHSDPEKKRRMAFSIITWGLNCVRTLSGAKLKVIGLENVPTDRPVLYAGNHRSFFDIVMGFPLLRYPTTFVAKIELKKVPILHNWLDAVDCQYMDRGDIKQNFRIIMNCIDLVKKGTSVYIFPEGTRSSGDTLLEFKEGSFRIAQRAHCPIIPVAISNTDDIFENHLPALHPVQTVIEFGKPIYMDQMDPADQRHVGRQVREIIAGMLRKNHIDKK